MALTDDPKVFLQKKMKGIGMDKAPESAQYADAFAAGGLANVAKSAGTGLLRMLGRKLGIGLDKAPPAWTEAAKEFAGGAEKLAEAGKFRPAGFHGEDYLNKVVKGEPNWPARVGYDQMLKEATEIAAAPKIASAEAGRTVVDKIPIPLSKWGKRGIATGVAPLVLAGGHEFQTAPEAGVATTAQPTNLPDIPLVGEIPLFGGGMNEKDMIAKPAPTVQPVPPPAVTKTATAEKLTPAQQLNKMGFETKIGGVGDTAALREGDGGMNTPTGFRWKTGGVGQAGKIIGPDEGTQNWTNKLRGIKDEKDNVTLEMMGVPSAMTGEEKVKKNLENMAAGQGAGAINAAKILSDTKGHEAQRALHENDLLWKRQAAEETRKQMTANSANQAEARTVDTLIKLHGQSAFEQGEDGKPVLNSDLLAWNLATAYGKDPQGYNRLDTTPLVKENVTNLMTRFEKYLAESRAAGSVVTDEKKFRNDMWQKFRKYLQKAPLATGV